MSDTESVDYLQPEFDPWTLTVPRLRSILVTYNVQYPSLAKKAQLVELFEEHVVPQSKKILAARARAKRTSMGIVDANSHSMATDFDNDHDLRPPPSVSRARSPRKTTRIKRESEDPDRLEPATPAPTRESPRKRQSRSVSVQPPPSDTDTGAEADLTRSVRRNRHATPSFKSEPPADDGFFKRTPETETVFTSDNPFQAGSPPPTAMKTPTNRRKTGGFESVRSTKTPSTIRRQTDGPFSDSNEPSTISRTFEMPVSKFSPRTPQPQPQPEPVTMDIEPGEEFTPDEQLALIQEEQADPRLAAARRASHQTPRKSSLTTPVWVLFTTLIIAYLGWYRQEKIAVGYCGIGRDARQLIPGGVQLPDWAIELKDKVGLQEVPDWVVPFLEPQCERCPPHAYCYEDFVVRCEPDFILKPHPLALGGLVPLPPTCEPDGEKVRRVRAVADKAVEELRERRAKYECGEPTEPEGQAVDSPYIEEQELKESLSKKRSKRMAADEFEELWVAAIGEVKARDEVVVEEQPEEAGGTASFPTTKLSSTSLARLSYSCAARRELKLGLARHRFSIVGLVSFIASILYARQQLITRRALNAQVPGLVNQVLDRLANQKELAFDDGGDDAFLFLPNLRDDVLRSVHSLAQRDRVWQRVRAVVEQNSNVRTGQREGRNGEVGRAWEWIGPSRPQITAAGEGGSAHRRRRSGVAGSRVSWGADVKNESAEDGKPEHRKWEESRPVY